MNLGPQKIHWQIMWHGPNVYKNVSNNKNVSLEKGLIQCDSDVCE